MHVKTRELFQSPFFALVYGYSIYVRIVQQNWGLMRVITEYLSGELL